MAKFLVEQYAAVGHGEMAGPFTAECDTIEGAREVIRARIGSYFNDPDCPWNASTAMSTRTTRARTKGAAAISSGPHDTPRLKEARHKLGRSAEGFARVVRDRALRTRQNRCR
jgi:hypothetical protein